MEKRAAFCSACDRNVPVLVDPLDWEGREPSCHDVSEAVVCLDYGVRCTGALCPMFRSPRDPPLPAHRTPSRAPDDGPLAQPSAQGSVDPSAQTSTQVPGQPSARMRNGMASGMHNGTPGPPRSARPADRVRPTP